METKIILIDKINNLEKEATAIVKLNFESKDYLIYSIRENEENCQIFASRLVLNSEGAYFLDNITAEEKGKLNTLIYNLVILIPTENKKGTDSKTLLNDISSKYFAKVSMEIPEFSNQEYYSNCSFAITNKALVEEAINFYKNNLQVEKKEEINNTIPSWDIPSADTAVTSVEMPTTSPVEISVDSPLPDNNINVENNNSLPSEVTIPEPSVEPTAQVPNISLNIPNIEPTVNNQPVEFAQLETPTSTVQEPVAEKSTLGPTPEVPNVAIVSDPTILNAVNASAPTMVNNNVTENVENKKAGFAINKFIVIGTICLVLAIAVVIVAYVLIHQKTTGA